MIQVKCRFVAAQSFEAEGLYLLRKKDQNLFSGTTRTKPRRSKKDKRRNNMASRAVTLSAQTLTQFSALQIKPPANVSEVAEAILQVNSKKVGSKPVAQLPKCLKIELSDIDVVFLCAGVLHCTAAVESSSGRQEQCWHSFRHGEHSKHTGSADWCLWR